jgi:hypothetical protein
LERTVVHRGRTVLAVDCVLAGARWRSYPAAQLGRLAATKTQRKIGGMPEISRFLGIVIAMYYREHGPAHFHAIYGDFEVTVEIETGHVNGTLPKRAQSHVLEWLGCIAPNFSKLGHSLAIASLSRKLSRWSDR